jgi:Protein of unknown function (DUF1501)
MPHRSSEPTFCEDFRRAASLTRRQLLQAGGLTGLGLLLPDLLRAQANQGPSPKGTFGRAKSIIVLYLHGGHAQQETWDPKPDGPSPARGEFGVIDTSLPGVHISELLPRSAKLMHKLAVIRSLSHRNDNHVQASLPAMTGHAHSPSELKRDDFPPSPSDFPPFGAVLDRLRPARKLPTWVQVGPLMRRDNGTVLHGQSPGFLGTKHSPLVIDQNLLADNVRIEAVAPNPELSLDRLSVRGDLLKQLDGQRRLLDLAGEMQTLDAHQQRALNLLTSPALGKAFQLGAEPVTVRDQYGRTPFGQSCLLARRLVEAGVPVVNVHFCRTPGSSWDTHGRHFSQMKDSLCPTFDRAFASLVADLDQRGLLGQTLVLATAEFGRTPKVNSNAGRDHWPWVYSVALAGGGAAEGMIYGSSDKIAAYPMSHPHDPCDLAATVYHLLGVSAETLVYDQTNRPYPLVIGQKIDGLLA